MFSVKAALLVNKVRLGHHWLLSREHWLAVQAGSFRLGRLLTRLSIFSREQWLGSDGGLGGTG